MTFDLQGHKPHRADKPKSLRRPGMQSPVVERYLDYQIEITERPASPISSRTVYSVRVDGGQPLLQSYLSGFLTEKSARAAAHAEIQQLEFKYGRDDSPIANILHSLKRQRAARRLREKASE